MTMGEEAKEVQGALALASAPSGSGGGDRRPSDPKLKRSTMIRLGQVLRTEYASVIQGPIQELCWLCST
jgi:hypothetical protein